MLAADQCGDSPVGAAAPRMIPAARPKIITHQPLPDVKAATAFFNAP